MADELSVRGPRELALLARARADLAEAKTIDEVRLIRDQAALLQGYAKKQRWCLEMQNDVAEIKVRAERRAGEMLAEMAKDVGGRPPKTYCNVQQVSTSTLTDLGIERTQSHRWQTIASLPDETFEAHVSRVKASATGELTSAGVLKLAKQLRAQQPSDPGHEPPPGDDGGPRVVASLSELVSAGRKFRTVYADPPWRYGNQGTRSATGNHYGTMTVDEICAEPVAALVGDDAHLHLWTTNAFLFDARRVIEAWGFEYKSCFVWVKPQMGIGNYWRVSHEFLLFGLRGATPFLSRDEMSWAALNRSEHSAKPDAVRHKVEKVSPGPYLEMYGRQYTPGSPWTVYGNQVSVLARSLFP